ncbi:LOW QUALITY PROTEIN: hypothetical protein HZS_139, partial [Henneguya salminicola]
RGLPVILVITVCFRSFCDFEKYYSHQTANYSFHCLFRDAFMPYAYTVEEFWHIHKYKISHSNRTNSLDGAWNIVENLFFNLLEKFDGRRKH